MHRIMIMMMILIIKGFISKKELAELNCKGRAAQGNVLMPYKLMIFYLSEQMEVYV